MSSNAASRAGLPERRLTVIFAVGAVVALAVLVIALVSRSSGSHGGSASASAGLHVGTSKYGPILVDAEGRTLYLFISDKHGESSCYGACAKVWPPLLESGAAKPGKGVTAALMTPVRRRDGTSQVAYHHHPLYRMSADKRPGQMAGQAFLGTWFVVSPHGNAITGGVKPSSGGY